MAVFIGLGTRFLLNGRSFEITKQLEKDLFEGSDLEFKGVTEQFSREDILANYEKGNLEFAYYEKTGAGLNTKVDRYSDFTMVPEKDKEKAMFRLRAIEPLLSLNVKSLRPYIKSRVDTLKSEGHIVSDKSLYRWMKAYKDSEGDIFSLVPSDNRARGNRLFNKVDSIIDQVIEEMIFAPVNFTATSVCEEVVHRIDLYNKEQKGKKEKDKTLLHHPSESTVRRRMKEYSKYDVAKARKGQAFAKAKFGQVNANQRPEYILQRVEVDHTRLDLFVVDEKSRLPIGRPWITVCLDVFSGYPLGYYIGFEPPSYTSVMHALSHAISPKTYISSKYPNIKNKWLAYGIPELLVLDNGKEFHSKHFIEACIQLQINRYYCKVKAPWYKGSVERHFRTINTELLHQTKGTTFSNTVQKGEYNPVKNAVISFDMLVEMFHKWLLDYYAQDFHNGIKGVPSEIWADALKATPAPPIPEKPLDWKIMLMKLGEGSIQRHGIRTNYLYYNSDQLFQLRHEITKSKGKNEVKFKYDPTNISKIYVYDECSKVYLEVPCTDQKYSLNLNEYAHKAILSKVRETKKSVDRSALAAAKAELMAMCKAETKKTLTVRRKEKRFEGVGSNQNISTEQKEVTVQDYEVRIEKPKKPKKKEPKVVSISEEIDYSDWSVFNAN
ncbi:Mu transposase C-terminal domain-containing protein [Bacillus sp. F19]|nr:Mu transposase C-terminal domain-containing protein [Bacillus sp. F19]